MAEQRYRFGGPIPESVQTLQRKRRYRDSESFATLKKNRRQDFWAKPPAGWEQERDDWGGVIGIRRALPAESAEARSVTYRFLEDEKDRVVADPGPISPEQVDALRVALLGRPGTTPGPWIVRPACAPTPPCSASAWSRIRRALAGLAARARRYLSARPE